MMAESLLAVPAMTMLGVFDCTNGAGPAGSPAARGVNGLMILMLVTPERVVFPLAAISRLLARILFSQLITGGVFVGFAAVPKGPRNLEPMLPEPSDEETTKRSLVAA